jgi:hypothetical protein
LPTARRSAPTGAPAPTPVRTTPNFLKGNDVVLYVTDGSDKPVDVTGAKAEATILANKQTQKVALEPAGANTLRGQANLGDSHDGVKVVTALTMPGQKPVQARFEMGHAGH